MRKRRFPLVIVLGAVLIGFSFSMLLGFYIRVQVGSGNCQQVLTTMEEILPERTAGIPGDYFNANMPVLEIDGVDYVAMLEIPTLNVSLPVVASWNDKKLFDTPARFYGSAYNRTLVIGGADYPHQFSFCNKIEDGTIVKVTDMTGAQFTYTVTRVERSKKAESTWLVNAKNDLTLFCRDTLSMEYIAVRCDLIYN